MIEPTDEMVTAFMRAAAETPVQVAGRELLNARAGLAAALAIVERDYDVSPKLPPVEHRRGDEIWWNHSAEAYEAECVCGETFSGWPRSDAEDRLLEHLEREARP